MIQRSSQAGSFSCPCSTTLYGVQEGNDELCVNNSKTIETLQKDSFAVILTQPRLAEVQATEEQQGNLVARI